MSAAVRGSPVTIRSGAPVRRSKLSAKNRAMLCAGCVTRKSILSQGSTMSAAAAMTGGMIKSPSQAAITTC